ncbi:MAG: hypothetical protein E7123_04690 [Bacteroidales bacterium]|nr:hypothetical protein [Bacteroidales bacterium]
MKRIIFILALAASIACSEKSSGESSVLADATELKVEQTDLTTVRLTWTDNAKGEKGYRIYLRGENDPYHVSPIETVDADVTEYIFTDLASGASYDFGVQAISDEITLHAKIVYLNDYKVLDREGMGNLEGGRKVAAPSDVEAVQSSNTSVTLTWKDNSTDEKGFNIYMKDASAETFGEPAASVNADVTTHEVTGLATGSSYVFAVQAAGESLVNDSKVTASSVITLIDMSKVPVVTEVKTSYAYIAVSYKVEKVSGSNPEHGICFSESGAPTVKDIKVLGPAISAKTEILQVVPNAYLEDGKEYQMSAFIKDGDTYLYSNPQPVKLDAQPEEVNLTWEKQAYKELADGIEIYKTTSQLNGRNFNAWYAIADPAKVDFKVFYPEAVGSKKTIKAQAEAAEGCQVLINGAIFGNYNIGVIMTEGKMTQQWHGEIEGCYWATDNQLYQVTRAIIGVDKNGKAGAYWVGVPQQGTFYYYNRPQTNVVGQAKYGKVTSTSPVEASSWEPYYALSCGPMVLYDGKVAADNSYVDGKHFYTNYECWNESNVYSYKPDRTAVGVTSDGKIVLFVCDGRIAASDGAYMKELGPIMKSIGCVHAMNLDGGGSTGMWVKGSGMINALENESSWRAVKSTLGFFKK